VGKLVLAICVVGCGRIGFDRLGDGDGGDGGGDGFGQPMASCAALAHMCGPGGTSSCCDSPIVSGGSFYRDFDVGTDGMYPVMTHPASVSDFRLDTYEINVGRFRQFVEAGQGTRANPPPAGAGARTLNGMPRQAGWDPAWNAFLNADTGALVAALSCEPQYQTWTNAPGANEALPMSCIDWYEAFAFCAWDGGFLPTDVEFNYAAAGGAEQRAFPWSSPPSSVTIDCSYANFEPGGVPFTCVNTPQGGVNRVGSESPKGDGKWGQADLAGNLFEWTLDDWGTYPMPCDDCAELVDQGFGKSGRSGMFLDPAMYVRGGYRSDPGMADGRGSNFGARCARAP